MNRVILHCDCNAYFASVESIDHPEYNDVPMAVCGDPQGRRGIILAKNEKAKKFGIQTAETVWQAQKKCPGLLLIPPRRHLYDLYCQKINDLYEQYTEQVEAFSIDESWLDVTASAQMHGDGKKIADELRRRVREELGLTISVGVSFNKIFAKIGSDYKKPDATTVISHDNFREILFPLPVTHMLFIGKAAAGVLAKAGIATIGDLAAASLERLAAILGKSGETVWAYANGLDESPVRRRDEHDPAKSIGNSITFHRDLVGMDDIRAGLMMLADSVGWRLRGSALACQTVQIQIKNPALQVINRQKTLRKPTALTREIYETAVQILEESWSPSAPIRMLMVTATSLVRPGEYAQQLSLFDEQEDAEREKQAQLEAAIDGIRQRFGRSAISIGRVVESDLSGEDWEIRRKKEGVDIP